MTARNFKFSAYWRVIAENTGYDFSGYSSESLNRRLESFISCERIGSADELREKLFADRLSQSSIIGRLLISYTEMFRDPGFFHSLRKNVFPYLSTYPKICIWHAGCATGEEAYSLAILLDELNLLSRCEIYATDINENNLKNASSGIFPLSTMQESISRYFQSGGKNNLSSYYTAFYDHIIFHQFLRERISFIKHDMIIEQPMKKFHLILCRNVFIYFNYSLQEKVLKLLCDNIYNYGYLGMGLQEHFVDIRNSDLTLIDNINKIYRKVI